MAIRQSFLPDQVPEVLEKLGLPANFEQVEVPSQRGSALIVGDRVARHVIKIANLGIAETEVNIIPARSEGIMNEARILAELGPDIGPRLERYYRDENLAVSQTEYFAGKTLRAGSDAQADLLAGLFAAVTTLHRDGIVHGDLHPGNVLRLDGEPSLRLIDFELARCFGEQVNWAGKAEFLSPRTAAAVLRGETFAATDYDDLFSVACMFVNVMSQSNHLPGIPSGTVRQDVMSQIAEGGVYGFDTADEQYEVSLGLLVETLNSQTAESADSEPLREALYATLAQVDNVSTCSKPKPAE